MIAVEVSKNPKNFDCSTCTQKYCDTDRALPGSLGPAPFDLYEIPGVVSSRTCLLPQISELSRECLKLFRHYKNGVLIRAGGLYDQPNRYITAMGIIDGHQHA